MIRQQLPWLALTAALAFLGFRASVALHSDLLQLQDARAVYAASKGAKLRALTGFDVYGREQLALPGARRYFAVFAIRAPSFDHDIEFWTDVASRLAARPEVSFVGICDSEACASRARQAGPMLFAVLGDAGWDAIQYTRSADEAGDALLVDAKSAVEETIPWRQSPSPEEPVRILLNLR